MQKYYLLYVSFPLPSTAEELRKQTDEVERLVGREATGSGAGFGMRDVDFSFDTAKDRRAAVMRLRAANKFYEISTPNWSERVED